MTGPGQDDGIAAELLGERERAQASDRRRWRRALAGAAAAHLLVLALPRPQAELGPPGQERQARIYELSDVRFAPPTPPPVPAEAAPAPEGPAPEEQAESPPGPPRPPRIEVLFPEGELSRLSPPKPLRAVPPDAPPDAPAAGGEVRLYLQLDATGRVLGVRAADGPPSLLPAARAAATGWVFLPATLDAQPIPVVVEVLVRFPPRQPAAPGGAP